MNIVHTRIWFVGLVSVVFIFAACQSSNAPPMSVETESSDDWQTYTNIDHKFSFQYPLGWQYKEVSLVGSTNQQKEVWFAAGEFPPAHTDAQPDLTLIITDDSPLARWEHEYFDEYQSDIIKIGDGTATKISGINRESLYRETVVILKLNEIYLQLLPRQSTETLKVFERLLTTFESEEAPSPDGGRISENVICIAPYFDPIAFLPGDNRILFRSDSGIMIFNLETLEEDGILEAPMPVVKAALSPDGNLLAWALEDHRIEILELPNGKVRNTLTGHASLVTAIKFSQLGDRLFTASHDNSVKIWNADGGLVSEFYPGGGEVLGMGVSPDDTELVIVTFEGPQKLWNLQSNGLSREIGSSGAFDGSDAAFSPNGQIVGIGLGGGPISLWDIENGTKLWSGGNYSLTLSQNEDLMAYSDMDENGNNLVLVRSLNDQHLIHILRGHSTLIWKVLFSADTSMLVSASGTEILIWLTNDGKLLNRLVLSCP